jgi:hypothetical protein
MHVPSRARALPLTSFASCPAVDAVTAFRKAHFTLVRQFILQPAAAMTGRDSPVGIIAPIAGTGGSNLAEFLSGRLLDTTRASLARSFDIFRSPLQRAMA